MSVIDDYLASLSDDKKSIIKHMYDVVRQTVPNTTEGLSYSMPCLQYKGKALVAIMANKNFLSIYPFCSIEKLGVDISTFEQTTGSIHFTLEAPVPDDLLKEIIQERKRQIEV